MVALLAVAALALGVRLECVGIETVHSTEVGVYPLVYEWGEEGRAPQLQAQDFDGNTLTVAERGPLGGWLLSAAPRGLAECRMKYHPAAVELVQDGDGGGDVRQ